MKKKATRRRPARTTQAAAVVGCETCVHWQRMGRTSLGVCQFGQSNLARATIPFWALRLQELTLAIDGHTPTCAAWKAA